ncbi:hypothetical protein [Melghirimyces profundicolus]|uniref:hypothetical protein n=1 Tax=Melghirimyces profundicolus TaxID=1242148 RepID=UPI000D3ABE55|nr:hypothetical protein [Melghirimyces profundicolus]
MSVAMAGWWVSGVLLVLWLIRLSIGGGGAFSRDGMVCSMSTGTAVGTGIGVYLPVAMGISFFPAALTGFAAGTAAGWAIGWKSGVRGVLEGTVAGWMGGPMGAMLAVMIPSESGTLLFHLTSVLVGGVLFMAFLIMSGSGRVSNRFEIVLFHPFFYFLLVAGFLITSHFHPFPPGVNHGSSHGGH